MANKMTQKDYFNAIINYLNGAETEVSTDDMVTFLKGRIDVLNAKSASRKPTKTQEENEVLKCKIVEVLTSKGQTVSEIMSLSEDLSGLSNQKVSALLKALCEEGKAVKSTDKRKSVFTLSTADDTPAED